MRKLAIAMALASTVLATPATAQDSGPYVGVEAGILKAQEIDFDYHDRLRNFEDAVTIGHELGWDADIIGGYDFGNIRAEAELSAKRASIHQVFYLNSLGIPGSANYGADGRTQVTSAMGNVLLDFGDGGWRGYVGGGAGLARVKLRAANDVGTASFSGSDNAMAWQLLAGFGREITPNVELGLKYRYFRTLALNYDFDDTFLPFEFSGGRFTSHSLLASLIYNFRAPPPPPVVVAPPPPPPPPPATQTCPDGSVILATDACPVPPPPPPPPPPEPERG